MDLVSMLTGASGGAGLNAQGRAIGTALFGGTPPDVARARTFSALAESERKMEDAVKERDARLARESLARAQREAGNADMADYIIAGINPQQFSGAAKDRQAIGWGDEAWKTATSDPALQGVELLNRMNMVREGKPIDLTKIEDHTVYDPTRSPANQQLITNDIGQALIQSLGARATASLSQAGASDSRGELYHRTDPNRLTGGAAELEWHNRNLQQALGRELTPQELGHLRAGKLEIKEPAPAQKAAAPSPDVDPALRSKALDALQRARAAVASGADVEAVRQRLIQAGYVNIAKVL
ncbi:hypothetical protein [Lysobacter sp. CA199]|uniref:hypothetical protein n=1 Tax=Lysobacter sp. CA199 TaxID=3455608 RepID=UPI003F8D2ACB